MDAASPSAPFPKILVCTDGSLDSEGAITAALHLAKTTGNTVFLLEVLFYLAGYELQSPDTLAPPVVNLELMEVQETAARERLEARKAEAAKEGVTLSPRIRTSGSAYEGILEEAGETQPDLIIMDGRISFISGGPAIGLAVHPGVILASGDPVALDVQGVRLLQNYAAVNHLAGDAWDLPQIKTAVRQGLGVQNDGQLLLVR